MIKGLLDGKSVLITGTGSGVGRAAAQLFAEHGARLVCADINAAWLEETAGLVREAGGEVEAIHCDVSKEDDVHRAIQAAVTAYGRLDVMYNNVGVASPTANGRTLKLVENTEEQYQRLIAVNIGGVVHGCKLAVRQFETQGYGGAIVNTASVAGLIGWGGVIYGGTKGAVVGLTRALAIEVAKQGIRVNSVCPAGMITNFGKSEPREPTEDEIKYYGSLHPMGLPISPRDAANAALFLASDLALNITGVNLAVDGGFTAGVPVAK